MTRKTKNIVFAFVKHSRTLNKIKDINEEF